MGFKLVCSECRGKFAWEGEWPNHCPLCGVDMSLPADDVISMPAIRTAVSKANDQVYRDIERGSEIRAQLAAEMTGATAAEMSGLKITDLNDRNDAEIAAVPVRNEVTKIMEQAPIAGNNSPFGFSAAGVGFSGSVSSGPFANSGARTMTALREKHAELTNYSAVGDRPANEVLNPGYRRRA